MDAGSRAPWILVSLVACLSGATFGGCSTEHSERAEAGVIANGDHPPVRASDAAQLPSDDSGQTEHRRDASAGAHDAAVHDGVSDAARDAIDAGGHAMDAGSGPTPDAGPSPDAAPSQDATLEAGPAVDDAGHDSDDAEIPDRAEPISLVQDWSVRKRLRSRANEDLLLEEQLTDLASAVPKPSRIVRLAPDAATLPSWSAPQGQYISDFCVHPSGAVSAVIAGEGGSVSLVRLDEHLALLATAVIHDPEIASDPHVPDAGVVDLVGNQLLLDPARIGSVGEDVVAAVFSSFNSLIAYRASFAAGAWSAPQRTLIEPPVSLNPNLPIGGSFDVFGAMTAWFRCSLDTDPDGNAYVAIWANQKRIREHVSLFHDGLTPLPGDPITPSLQDSDVLLTKLDPQGALVWSRVVGTAHEDEPYALRAHGGSVAVVGRARRLPGFDNTSWDTFIAVTTSDGADIQARTIAFDSLSVALAVDGLPNGGWVVAGSDGWTQNRDGLSILTFGAKLLFELPSIDAAPVRLPLPAGPRHNEIRTLLVSGQRVHFGGHEDGPITHTGDGDASQVHATGVLGSADLISDRSADTRPPVR